MELNPALQTPWLPDIGVRFVPENEKRDALAFQHNLIDLKRWADDFSASLALYDLSARQPRAELGQTDLGMLWCLIAARNGGLALRNFAQCLSAARGVAGKVTFWAGKIDLQALKAVNVEFHKRFPDIDKLRHAVAHPEFYGNPKKDMTGAYAELPGLVTAGGVQMQDVLVYRTYAATINGMTVSYQLSIGNALFVVELTRRAFAAVGQIVQQAANNRGQVKRSGERDASEVAPED
jgi:hypothetical protein